MPIKTPKSVNEALSHISLLVQEAEKHSDQQKETRDDALEYYDGCVKDLKTRKGRSTAVSSDVRVAVRKVIPSVMRTLLGNDKIVQYKATHPNDEGAADSATVYVNQVVVKESKAEAAIYDAIHDAMLLRTGILTWRAEKDVSLSHTNYTDQSADEMAAITQDDDNEVMDVKSTKIKDAETLQAIAATYEAAGIKPPKGYDMRHSFTVRRRQDKTNIRLKAIPRGAFLINSEARNIDEAVIVGERVYETRSELVAQGYDKDKVATLSVHSSPSQNSDDFDDDLTRRQQDFTHFRGENNDRTAANENILVYRVYVKLDIDGDGIAEMHHLVLAEGGGNTRNRGDIKGKYGTKNYVVLEHNLVDEAPYADVKIERAPHQFEGHSLFEDIREIQRIKTAILRNSLDSVYLHLNPTPFIDPSAVRTRDALYNPELGRPVELNPGTDARKAVQYNPQPFVGNDIFNMLGYLDKNIADRTGLNEQQGTLTAEQLANVAATTAHLLNESNTAQIYAMMKQITRGGLTKAFNGLLKLVVENADDERMVQIQGEWQVFDPRQWNSNFDCEINIGLGTTSRESDLNILQLIYSVQKDILTGMGPNNPLVGVKELHKTLTQIVETAGLPSASPYFTEPTDQAIQAMLQAQQQNPEAQKQQHDLQLAEIKKQGMVEVETLKAQASANELDAKQTHAKEMEEVRVRSQEAIETNKAEQRSRVEEIQYAADARVEEIKAGFEDQANARKMTSDDLNREADRSVKVYAARLHGKVELVKSGAMTAEEAGLLGEEDPYQPKVDIGEVVITE